MVAGWISYRLMNAITVGRELSLLCRTLMEALKKFHGLTIQAGRAQVAASDSCRWHAIPNPKLIPR
jgi:hypothetical protein